MISYSGVTVIPGCVTQMVEDVELFRESEDFLGWAKKQEDEPDFYWKRCFDAISSPAFIMSANGVVLICNKAFEDFIRQPAEGIKGKKCFSMVHGTGTFIEGCPFLKSRKSGMKESYTLKMSGKWYQVTVDPIFDREENFAGAVHIIADVDDMLKNNAKIALLGRVIENTKDGIISTDLECNVTGWNGGAERMLGFTKEEVIGKPFTELCSYNREENPKEKTEERKETFIERIDAKFRNKKGEMLDVSLGISPIYNEMNVISGNAYILTDHTKQRKTEQNLLSFMAESVTRLEKPLEMIKTNIEDTLDLYQNGDIDSKELADLLAIQVANANKIIENIIELKKSTAGVEDSLPNIMKDFFRI